MCLAEQIEKIKNDIAERTFEIMWGKTIEEWVKEQTN